MHLSTQLGASLTINSDKNEKATGFRLRSLLPCQKSVVLNTASSRAIIATLNTDRQKKTRLN